jgi:hypothetical protein
VKLTKVVYRPVGMALGTAGGLLAGAVFKRTWMLLGHDDDAPDPLDEDRRMREILLAAALQGAIFAVVRASVDRAGANATRRLTGSWPG